MDMSQFDTYDYGYEDDDRSEEIQDSFENISRSTQKFISNKQELYYKVHLFENIGNVQNEF